MLMLSGRATGMSAVRAIVPYHFRSGVCPLVARVAFGLRDETYDVSANDEINASNVGSANVPVPIIMAYGVIVTTWGSGRRAGRPSSCPSRSRR